MTSGERSALKWHLIGLQMTSNWATCDLKLAFLAIDDIRLVQSQSLISNHECQQILFIGTNKETIVLFDVEKES